MQTLPEEAQKDALLRLWTAKESYLKYLGRGLRVPLDSFCVRLDENGASLQAPGASSALRLHEYTHDGCRICLCTKSPLPAASTLSSNKAAAG